MNRTEGKRSSQLMKALSPGHEEATRCFMKEQRREGERDGIRHKYLSGRDLTTEDGTEDLFKKNCRGRKLKKTEV